VPVREIQEGIRHGVRKVNVNTDLRLAATGAIRKAFAEDPGEFDPHYYLKPARAAMQEVVKARMEAFGQAGHAGDYEPISLEDMAVRYREEGHQLTVA
jgi:fructose-bisphosphate aldolase class II